MKPFILAITLLGCSASTRSTAINAAYNTTVAAGSAFVAFDGPYEQSIVAKATSKAAADASLVTWQSERAKVQMAITAAYQAETAAALANDNATLATMTAAVAALVAELKADGLVLP